MNIIALLMVAATAVAVSIVALSAYRHQHHQVVCRHPAEKIRRFAGDQRLHAGPFWRWCTTCGAGLPDGDLGIPDAIEVDERGNPVLYEHDGPVPFLIVATGRRLELRAIVGDKIHAVPINPVSLRGALERYLYERGPE